MNYSTYLFKTISSFIDEYLSPSSASLMRDAALSEQLTALYTELRIAGLAQLFAYIDEMPTENRDSNASIRSFTNTSIFKLYERLRTNRLLTDALFESLMAQEDILILDELLLKVAEAGLLSHPSISAVLQTIIDFNPLHRQDDLIHFGLKYELIRASHLKEDFLFFLNYRNTASMLIMLCFLEQHAILNLAIFSRLKSQDNLPELASIIIGLTFSLNQTQASTFLEMLLNQDLFPQIYAHFSKINFDESDFEDFEALFQAENIVTSIEKLSLFFSCEYFDSMGKIDAKILRHWQIEDVPLDIIPMLQSTSLAPALPEILPLIATSCKNNDTYLSFKLLYENGFLSPTTAIDEAEQYLQLLLNSPFILSFNELIQSSFARLGIAADKSFALFKKAVTHEETHLALTSLLPSIDPWDGCFNELDENLCDYYDDYLGAPENLENCLKVLELIISSDDALLPEPWVKLKQTHFMKILDILLDSQHMGPWMIEKLSQTPNDVRFRKALMLYANITRHPQYAICEYFEMFDLDILNIESFPLIFELSLQHADPLVYARLVTKLIANDLTSVSTLNELARAEDLPGLDALFDLLLPIYIETAPHPTDVVITLLQHPTPLALANLIDHKFKTETSDLKQRALFIHLLELREIGQFEEILDSISPELLQSSELMMNLMSYPHQAIICQALKHLKGKILLKQESINFLLHYPFPELMLSCAEHTGFVSHEDLVLLLNQSALIKISQDNLIPIPEDAFTHEEPCLQLIESLVVYEKAHPHKSFDQLDCWSNLKRMHELKLLNASRIRFILKHPQNQLNALLIQKILLISNSITLAPTMLFDNVLSHSNPDLLLETLEKLHAKERLNTERFIYLCSETNLNIITCLGVLIEKNNFTDEQLSAIMQKFVAHSDKSQTQLLKIFKLLPKIEDARTALQLHQLLMDLDETNIKSAYFFFKTEIAQRVSKHTEGLDIIFDYFTRCGIKRAYHFMGALSDSKIFQLTQISVVFRELRALLSHKNLDLIVKFSPFILNLTAGNVQINKNNLFLLRTMPFDNLIIFYEHFRTINQAVFELLMRQNCNLPKTLKLIEELVASNLVSDADEESKLKIFETTLLIDLKSFLNFHHAFPLIDSSPEAFKELLEHPKLSDIGHLINFYTHLSKVNFSEVPMKTIFETCLEMSSPYDAGYLWWTLYDADLWPAINFEVFKTICKRQPLLFDLAGSVNNQRELYRGLNKKNAVALFYTFASCPKPDDFGIIKLKLDKIAMPSTELYFAILDKIAKHPHFLALRDIIHFLDTVKILDVDILKSIVVQDDFVNLKHFLNLLHENKILNKEKILTLFSKQDFQERWRLLGYIRQCLTPPIESLFKFILQVQEVKLMNQFCVFLDENNLLKPQHLIVLLRSSHVIFHHPEVKARFQNPKDMLLSSINLIYILKVAQEYHDRANDGAQIIYHLLQSLAVNSRSAQSTHLQSVHESANLSALKLQTRYQHELADPLFLTAQFKILKENIEALSTGSVRAVAMRCLERLQTAEYQIAYNTPISVTQLLGLCIYAAQDTANITSSSNDAFLSLIDRLLEIQRGYNEADEYGRDQSICVGGGFNKLIESMVGIHPDCEQMVISLEAASQKLPRIVVHQTKYFFLQQPLPCSEAALAAIEMQLRSINSAGIESIWPMIRERILDELFSEFILLFKQKDNPDLIAMVDCAMDIDGKEFADIVAELKTHFRKQFAEMPYRLFFHKNDSAEAQHRFDQAYGLVLHQAR